MTEKITVIIPTYNRAQWVKRTVESALYQTHPDVEVIVVDDGSTDNTKDILQPFIGFPGFRYLYQANKGRSVARNEGAKKAAGNWIMYLDSDDYLERDALEKLYKLALEAEDSTIVYANFRYVSGNQEVGSQGFQLTGKALNTNLFLELTADKLCLTKTGTYLIKKKSALETGGFITRFEPAEDFDYAIKSLLTAKVSYISDRVLNVERHPGNTGDRELQLAYIKVWKYYLASKKEWTPCLGSKERNTIRNAFKLRVANFSYEVNNHGQAFIYYAGLIKSKPLVLFEGFIIKQLFASLLPWPFKIMVKRISLFLYTAFSLGDDPGTALEPENNSLETMTE